MSPTREKLIDAAKAGDFLGVCYGMRKRDNSELKRILAELHNEGAIDLLAEFARLGNDGHPAPDFFIMRDLFAGVLPNLAVAVKSACECVKSLADKAGQDMAADWVWEAYQQFLEKDEKRIKEGLRMVLEGEAPAVSLPSVILAGFRVNFGAYFGQCTDIVRDRALSDEHRASALWSFSRTETLPNDPLIAGKIVDLLEHLCGGQESESVLGNVPLVAVGCAVLDPGLGERVQAVIACVSKSSLPMVQYKLSIAGMLYAKKTPLSLRRCILFCLVGTRIEHKGILRNIDYILTSLLESSHGDVVIEFLYEYVAGHEREERITKFSSALQALVLNPNRTLDIFVTKCFLSSDRAHLFAVDQLVRHFHGRQAFEVHLDPSQLPEPRSAMAHFLARKAIGYCYFIPEACVSYVVSALGEMEDGERAALQQVFINPFALSYSAYINKFISANGASLSKEARQFLETAVRQAKLFFEDIQQMGVIKELLPSVKQAETHNRRWNLLVEKSMEEAHKNSIISKIGTNIILIRGRGWVTYRDGKDGVPFRQVHLLKRISSSVEYPVLWNVDPFGLDYTLRICRAERVVK